MRLFALFPFLLLLSVCKAQNPIKESLVFFKKSVPGVELKTAKINDSNKIRIQKVIIDTTYMIFLKTQSKTNFTIDSIHINQKIYEAAIFPLPKTMQFIGIKRWGSDSVYLRSEGKNTWWRVRLSLTGHNSLNIGKEIIIWGHCKNTPVNLSIKNLIELQSENRL